MSEYFSPNGRKFHSKEAIKEFVDAATFKQLTDEGLLIDNRKKGNRMTRYVCDLSMLHARVIPSEDKADAAYRSSYAEAQLSNMYLLRRRGFPGCMQEICI